MASTSFFIARVAVSLCGDPRRRIGMVGHGSPLLHRHATAGDGPRLVLFQHERADEAAGWRRPSEKIPATSVRRPISPSGLSIGFPPRSVARRRPGTVRQHPGQLARGGNSAARLPSHAGLQGGLQQDTEAEPAVSLTTWRGRALRRSGVRRATCTRMRGSVRRWRKRPASAPRPAHHVGRQTGKRGLRRLRGFNVDPRGIRPARRRPGERGPDGPEGGEFGTAEGRGTRAAEAPMPGQMTGLVDCPVPASDGSDRA